MSPICPIIAVELLYTVPSPKFYTLTGPKTPNPTECTCNNWGAAKANLMETKSFYLPFDEILLCTGSTLNSPQLLQHLCGIVDPFILPGFEHPTPRFWLVGVLGDKLQPLIARAGQIYT